MCEYYTDAGTGRQGAAALRISGRYVVLAAPGALPSKPDRTNAEKQKHVKSTHMCHIACKIREMWSKVVVGIWGGGQIYGCAPSLFSIFDSPSHYPFWIDIKT